jgi:hypothetical protein
LQDHSNQTSKTRFSQPFPGLKIHALEFSIKYFLFSSLWDLIIP